jgi:hypothetical protein
MMEGFREAIVYCKFSDLGFSGLPYTWRNKQQYPNNIKVRLDRALGDVFFIEKFDNTYVRHVQTTSCDHCCLLITIKQSGCKVEEVKDLFVMRICGVTTRGTTRLWRMVDRQVPEVLPRE